MSIIDQCKKLSGNDKWGTPTKLYDELNQEFKFNFDPAPISYKDGDPDGLLIDWGTSNFVNPPYSGTAKWIKKAYEEHLKGNKSVMLINVCTDTKAFHKYCYNKQNIEIRFIQGRIKFINHNNEKKVTS
jgi:hypothetical protein